MTIAQKPPLTIDIADEIRRDETLFSLVSEATLVLQSLFDEPDLEVENRELRWELTSRHPKEVAAVVTETDGYGERRGRIGLTENRLRDPIARANTMSQLVRQLLRQQFFQIGARINRGLSELESEDVDAHSD